MLLKNIVSLEVKSALQGQTTLDNYFTTKKPKKQKPPKVKIGTYGVVGLGVNNSGDGEAGDGGGE